MMGYLAEQDNFEPKTLKEAMAYGIVVASFTVEDFSLDRLEKIDRDDLERRMEEYRKMLSFLARSRLSGYALASPNFNSDSPPMKQKIRTFVAVEIDDAVRADGRGADREAGRRGGEREMGRRRKTCT